MPYDRLSQEDACKDLVTIEEVRHDKIEADNSLIIARESMTSPISESVPFRTTKPDIAAAKGDNPQRLLVLWLVGLVLKRNVQD